MQVHAIYTAAVVTFMALFAVSRVVLLRGPHHDHRLLEDKRRVALYAASKLSPVLAVACAVAADASGGTSAFNAGAGIAGLVLVAALVAWSIHARLTGRFFGLAHMLRGS